MRSDRFRVSADDPPLTEIPMKSMPDVASDFYDTTPNRPCGHARESPLDRRTLYVLCFGIAGATIANVVVLACFFS
jgi:hypothetical protein